MAALDRVQRSPIAIGRRPALAGLGLAALLWALPIDAARAEARLPLANQVPLILKLLTYENRLMSAPPDTIHLGLLFVPEDEESRRCMEEFSSELGRFASYTVRGRPVALVPLPVTARPGTDWPRALVPLDVVYVAPGADKLLGTITKITRSAKILTITGVRSCVEGGLSAGILMTGDRPEIAINMLASRQEGREWDGSLLQVCRLIR